MSIAGNVKGNEVDPKNWTGPKVSLHCPKERAWQDDIGKHTSAFKAKLAVECIKRQQTVQELAAAYGVHPHQITTWKRQLIAAAEEVFSGSRAQREAADEEEREELYQTIGKLKVGIGLVAKKIRNLATVTEKRECIERDHRRLSIARQCELMGLPRSSWYYEAQAETAENLRLMRLLDEQYTRTPFYGSRRMVIALRQRGWNVNRKRVRRLMQQMAIEAIYPKPRLSDPAPGHKIYPYRLSGLAITRPNQVWGTDITYLRLRHGFLYLVAILDWFSRYVVAWELSNTLDTGFCLSALDRALAQATPEIFNSDQGAQFTSHDFTTRLESAGTIISMDGRGRALGQHLYRAALANREIRGGLS